MTTGINWEKGHISAEHWTKGYRENTEDLPDIIALSSQILKMEKKRENILKKILQDASPKLKKKSEKFRTKTHYCKLKQLKISQECSKKTDHLLPVSLKE